ncbi:MAG: hypothetical protein JSU59_09105, partial [Nitrospirota bacterium]
MPRHHRNHHNWGNAIIQLFRDPRMKLFDPSSHFGKEKGQSEERFPVIMDVPHLIWLLSLFLLMSPIKVESFPHHNPVDSFFSSFQPGSWEDVSAI